MQQNADATKFDSTPPLDHVLQAIKTLYHDQTSENKDQAGRWLTALQKSIYAWKVADELLIARTDLESCYFAAQTLRTKLQFSFAELPNEAWFSLKDSIINHLKIINEVAIQAQLALSITYLAILVPAWQNPVEELVSKDLNRFVLVEILTFLPEELDPSRNQNLKGIGANRRQQFNQYLSKIAPQIISLLNNFLQETLLLQQTEASIGQQQASTMQMTEKLVSKIYRCLGAWINIIDSNDINIIEPLLASIFESLKDADLCDNVHDAAADTICGTALLCENYAKYTQLTHYLLGQIYELEGVYHRSVVSEEIDKSVNYSRIFTEMAESIVSPLIVEAAYTSLQSAGATQIPGSKMIDLLLHCVAHYDYEVAEITFHFWYRFSELIHKKGNHLLPLFAGTANRLMLGLTRHCQLECDQEGLLEYSSDLFEFRTRVRDLIKEVIFIMGAAEYMRINNVLGLLEHALGELAKGSPEAAWEDVEAQLFIISCIVRDFADDGELVSQVVNFVLHTQTHAQLHIQIFATCCSILGEIADWLERNTAYLDPVLNYLLAMITSQPNTPVTAPPEHLVGADNSYESSYEQPTLASIAANSLQQIIGCNARVHLMGNVNLINVLIEICSRLDAVLNEPAAHNLLQCCATIISSGVNAEPASRQQQEELIVRLLQPSLDNLNSLICNGSNANTKSPIIYLDRISAVFRALQFKSQSEEQSLLNSLVSQQIWPLVDRLLTGCTDKKLVERSCRCLRCIIRCLKPVWLLKPIATSIVNLYQANPTLSPYLYLASILVDEFGASNNPEITNGLISMLNAFCLPTFSLLTASESQLANNTETIEDFFRLCARFLQKNAEQFLKESILTSILELTVASLVLENRDANKSVTKFIIELFACSSPSRAAGLHQLLQGQLVQAGFGQRITQAVVMGGLFHLPSFFIPEMSEILLQIVQWDNKQAGEWLQCTLSTIPTHTNAGVATIEPRQLEEFYNNVLRANNAKMVASLMRYISRLLR